MTAPVVARCAWCGVVAACWLLRVRERSRWGLRNRTLCVACRAEAMASEGAA